MRKSTYDEARGAETFILPLLKENLEEALNELPATRELDILDIGCGNQPFRRTIQNKQHNYFGLDTEQNEQGNVEFIADLNSSIDINRKFDVIICTEVLEHVHNWETAFTNFENLLKSKGRLIVTSPFIYGIHEAPNDFWRPTIFGLEKMVTIHGFKIITSKRLGDTWDVLGTIASCGHLVSSKKSFKTSLLYRVVFKIQKILMNGVSVSKLRNRIQLDSSFYMSNLIVAEKI